MSPSSRLISVWLSFLALLLVTTSVVAQENPPIRFEANSPWVSGPPSPFVRILSDEPLEDVTVTLTLDRTQFEEHFDLIQSGAPGEVSFESPFGVQPWRVTVEGQWREGPFTLWFDMPFEVSEGLDVDVPMHLADLDGQTLTVFLNRPAAGIEYEVLAEDGSSLGTGTVGFDSEPAGTPLTLHWEQRPGMVFQITLRAHDVAGYWTEVDIVLWSVEIPHEEVHFASGSSVIEAGEQHKIDTAYDELVASAEPYGNVISINLYIAGYTDTVGSAHDNQTLSEQRARAIARAFHDRGFSYPIYYQGFGEDVLAVPTGDETDEGANRRALYILGSSAPSSAAHLPRSDWHLLD